MLRILLIVILLIISINSYANTTYSPIIIGEKYKEKPSVENGFDENKYNYTSNNPETALFFLGLDYFLNKKTYKQENKNTKLNTKFDYLDEFEKNVHTK